MAAGSGDFANVPTALLGTQQWVTWKSEVRGGKPTKVPYNARTGSKAQSDNPSTWSSFPDAVQAFNRGGYTGVGFVFSPDDPYCGIDLDHALDPDTGELSDWARDIIQRVNSYAEWSPSGEGIHLIAAAKLPPGGRKIGSIEMYDRERYFTMTGRRLILTPDEIQQRQIQVEALHADVFKPRKRAKVVTRQPSGVLTNGRIDIDDVELLNRAGSAKNGALFRRLWSGDISGYESQSNADAALCALLAFWTNGDTGRMDRLFRQSGLIRDKWDHAARRGETYGEGTIREAVAICAEHYSPPLEKVLERVGTNGHTAKGAGVPPTDAASDGRDREPSPAPRPTTQLGNSERLVDQFGDDLLYCKTWGDWLVWDGRRWKVDRIELVTTMAKEVVRGIYREASEADSKEDRRDLASWAVRSEASAQIAAMIELARSARPSLPDQFDQDIWLLNVANGTVDLRTGELLPHLRLNSITKLIEVDYDPKAGAPRWLEFLERVQPDETVRLFLQRAAGYSATGSARERCVLIPHGSGKNGKGVFLQTLRQIFGEYAVRTPSETFLAKKADAIPNDVAQLRGTRLAFASETNEGRRLGEATIKDLTGGEDISARFMRGEWFSFVPTFTPWLATNHKPVVTGTDLAIWDRIRLIPFDVRIPDEEQDPRLLDKLRDEYAGILAWVVRGAIDWYQNGLGAPSAVVSATDSYRNEMDVLGAFIAERCVVDRQAFVAVAPLYSAYSSWCEQGGEKPISKRAAGLQLAERGFSTERGTGGIRRWVGLRLLAADEAPPIVTQVTQVTSNQASPRARGAHSSRHAESDVTCVTCVTPRQICQFCSREISEKRSDDYCSDACRDEDLPL